MRDGFASVARRSSTAAALPGLRRLAGRQGRGLALARPPRAGAGAGALFVTPGRPSARWSASSACRQGRRGDPVRGHHLSRRPRRSRRSSGCSWSACRRTATASTPQALRRRPARACAQGRSISTRRCKIRRPLTIPSPRARDRIVAIAGATTCRSSRTTPMASSRPTARRRFAAIAPESDWHIAGLAKCIGAGLRLAYVVAPDPRRAGRSPPPCAPLSSWRRRSRRRWRRAGSKTAPPTRSCASSAPRHRRAQRIAAEILPGDLSRRPAQLQHLAAAAQRLDALGLRQPYAVDRARRRASDAFVVSEPPPEAVRICICGPSTRAQIRSALEYAAHALVEELRPWPRRSSGLHSFSRGILRDLASAGVMRVGARSLLDVVCNKLCITPDAGETPRAPGVEPRQPEEIKSRHGGDAAHVRGLAAPVEHRQVDPAVVGAKADAPDDAGDAGRTSPASAAPARAPTRVIAARLAASIAAWQ